MAAFSVSTLRRAADNAIDWFSIALFVLALIGAWVYFIAWNTGTRRRWPLRSRESCRASTPDDRSASRRSSRLRPLSAWVALAAWRVRVRPPMLWRGPALAAAGLTAMWVAGRNAVRATPSSTTAACGRPPRCLATRCGALAGPGACVQAYQLPVGMRAMLAYHGAIRFGRQGDNSEGLPHRASSATASGRNWTTHRRSATGNSPTKRRGARVTTRSSASGCAGPEPAHTTRIRCLTLRRRARPIRRPVRCSSSRGRCSSRTSRSSATGRSTPSWRAGCRPPTSRRSRSDRASTSLSTSASWACCRRCRRSQDITTERIDGAPSATTCSRRCGCRCC